MPLIESFSFYNNIINIVMQLLSINFGTLNFNIIITLYNQIFCSIANHFTEHEIRCTNF